MTVTITADYPATCITPGPARLVASMADVIIGSRGVPAVWSNRHRDQLVIVEAVTERPLAELRSAVISKPSDVLNGIGSMEFTCPAEDPTLLDCLVDPTTVDLGAGELKLIGREVQWWRDGELRWAGPVVSGDTDLKSGTVTFRAFDHGWYLSRRFIGAAQRRDLLSGIGSMDRSGLPSWGRAGSVTAVRNTTTKVRGAGSAQLSGAGAITASFTHPATTGAQDGRVFLTAMVRLPAGLSNDDPIMTIEAIPTGTATVYRPGDYTSARVDSETEAGVWVRVTALCHLKPNVTNRVTVTLWSLSGSNTYFDDVRAMKNDTTGINPGEDLTVHAAALLNHAQSARKGSFGFRFKALSTSGVSEVLGARHMEHQQILDRFSTYTDRDDGWDWWIDPRNRTLYVAARRGVDHTNLALDEWTALSGGWSHDETDKSSAVVVLGEGGDGVDRPEGGYTDTTDTEGLVLDKLVRAPNGTPLSALDPLARQEHERASQPQTTLSPIRVPGSWWADVQPGDRFPTHMRCGVLRPSVPDDGFRVQQVTYDIDSDTLELV